MDIKEFAALKVGDEIENLSVPGSGVGRVCEIKDSGVSIAWGHGSAAWPFFYSVSGTTWYNWSKIE